MTVTFIIVGYSHLNFSVLVMQTLVQTLPTFAYIRHQGYFIEDQDWCTVINIISYDPVIIQG